MRLKNDVLTIKMSSFLSGASRRVVLQKNEFGQFGFVVVGGIEDDLLPTISLVSYADADADSFSGLDGESDSDAVNFVKNPLLTYAHVMCLGSDLPLLIKLELDRSKKVKDPVDHSPFYTGRSIC